jgi:hypothetical protein
MPTPGVIEYPAALDTALSLIEVNNNASDTLTGNISVSDLLIPVANPGKFSQSGFVTLVDSLTAPTKIEIALYTSKSGSNLVVPPGGRGAQGTTPFAFSTGNFAEQRPTARHHTALRDLLIAIEQKLGIGADTPGTGIEALMSNGAGASQWRSLTGADVANVVRKDDPALQTIISNLVIQNTSPVLQFVDTDGSDAEIVVQAEFLRIGRLGQLDLFLNLATGAYEFGQVPLGPGVDPTLANHLARKGYVDSRKTRFSVTAGFILDPSVNPPSLDATQLPVWVVPVGITGGFLSRFGIIRFGGAHNPGTSIEFSLIVSSVPQASIQFNDTNNAGFVGYVIDFADVAIPAGQIVWVVVSGRNGVIAERSVTMWFEGYQSGG